MTRLGYLAFARYQTSTAWLSACAFTGVLIAMGVLR